MSETEYVLSAEEFLNDDTTEYAKVTGLKPGTVMYIKSVTAGDVIVWSEAGEGEAKRTAGIRLVIKSAVDGIPGKTKLKDGAVATGKLIFNDTHIEALKNKSHKVIESILRGILKLNGMKVKGADGETEAEVNAKND